MITQQIDGYWLAEQTLHGRLLLAEGETRQAARASMYELIEVAHRRACWTDGYQHCKRALESGLSVWRREICPYAEGTPQRDGWLTFVSEQVSELRAVMGERA